MPWFQIVYILYTYNAKCKFNQCGPSTYISTIPGHFCKLQSLNSAVGPSQSFPPLDASCCTSLVLFWVPPLHVAVHSLHACQWAHLQFPVHKNISIINMEIKCLYVFYKNCAPSNTSIAKRELTWTRFWIACSRIGCTSCACLAAICVFNFHSPSSHLITSSTILTAYWPVRIRTPNTID